MGAEYINQLCVYGPESEIAMVTDDMLRKLFQGCKVHVERGPDSIKAEWLSYGDPVAADLLECASIKCPRLQFRIDWGCANDEIEGLVVVSRGKVWCNSKWPGIVFGDVDGE